MGTGVRVELVRRLRLVTRDARLAVGLALGVALVVVPLTILVVLLALGETSEPAGLALLGAVTLGGCYTLYDVLRQAGRLELPPGRLVRDSSGLYGRWVREPEPSGRVARPLHAVVVVLLMVLVGPFVVAVPMAWLGDQHAEHPTLARFGMLAFLLLLGAAVRVVTMRLVGRRRGGA
jgi:hypothetical protein